MSDDGPVELTDFLLARIEEDEDRARDAAGWDKAGRTRLTGRWSVEGVSSVVDELGRTLILSDSHSLPRPVAYHVVGWNPARVLADCEAKRRIIDAWQSLEGDSAVWPEAFQIADAMLAPLGLPYVDHPDYRPEWTP